jgi:molybdate transport system substrate-binding protein
MSQTAPRRLVPSRLRRAAQGPALLRAPLQALARAVASRLALALALPLALPPALALSCLPASARADQITVFAAASLTPALDRVAAAWGAATGHGVTLSYAGSSALARQIQQGAPADIFIAASSDWMDALTASGDLRADSRRDILSNRLVLIAHGRNLPPVALDDSLDLPALLGEGRLAMALVDAVPAGIYGRAALTALGQWEAVAPRVAQADNVRAALAYVARNEAPLGIVYATDAAASDQVSIIATFPADSRPTITSRAALTAQTTNPAAAAFLTYLTTPAARTIRAAAGFLPLD